MIWALGVPGVWFLGELYGLGVYTDAYQNYIGIGLGAGLFHVKIRHNHIHPPEE